MSTYSATNHKAKRTKNDEFYTLYSDIEKTLSHFKEELKNKKVICPTNDFNSEFYHYLKKQDLKELITVEYIKQERSLFEEPLSTPRIRINENIETLTEDGDYKSEEVIEKIKESEVIITNPPFSLLTDFFRLIQKEKKQFLILVPIHSIGYKDIFIELREQRVYIPLYESKQTYFFKDTDNELRRVSCVWLTNLKNPVIENEKKPFIKTIEYDPRIHKEFDHYRIINCPDLKSIPRISGGLAVPITFMRHWNPKQFEILKAHDYRKTLDLPTREHGLLSGQEMINTIDGKLSFGRVIVKNIVLNSK